MAAQYYIGSQHRLWFCRPLPAASTTQAWQPKLKWKKKLKRTKDWPVTTWARKNSWSRSGNGRNSTAMRCMNRGCRTRNRQKKAGRSTWICWQSLLEAIQSAKPFSTRKKLSWLLTQGNTGFHFRFYAANVLSFAKIPCQSHKLI